MKTWLDYEAPKQIQTLGSAEGVVRETGSFIGSLLGIALVFGLGFYVGKDAKRR